MWIGTGSVAALAIFCAGAWFDHSVMKATAPQVDQPIATDFCFVAKNYFLFAGKRFVVQADLEYGIDSHFMQSSECPDAFMTFDLTPKARAEVGGLKHHGGLGDMTIPAKFVGTIAEDPTWLRYAMYTSKPGAGMRPSITVEEFVAEETKR
jgi:hypothetical protein